MLCVIPKNNDQTSPFNGKSGWFVQCSEEHQTVCFRLPLQLLRCQSHPTRFAFQLTSFVRGADFVVYSLVVKHRLPLRSSGSTALVTGFESATCAGRDSCDSHPLVKHRFLPVSAPDSRPSQPAFQQAPLAGAAHRGPVKQVSMGYLILVNSAVFTAFSALP